MKPLSKSLEELAARVKVLEDSAAATLEADRAKLEQRRHEMHGLDVLIIAAHGERLGIGQCGLKLGRQLVHTHR